MQIDATTDARVEDCVRELHHIAFGSSASDQSSATVTAVGVLEGLVDDYLDLLITQSGVAESVIGAELIAANADAMHSTWPSRRRWMKDGFGVTVDESHNAELDAVLDLRNGIVHGRGRLTRRQVKSLSAVASLRTRLEKHVGVSLQGREMVFSGDTARLAALICARYAVALGVEVAKSQGGVVSVQ